MTINEIIKKLILKNNVLFNSVGVKIVSVYDALLEATIYNKDKAKPGCNMCAVNDTDTVYIHSRCLDDWKTEIFTFRDWSKVSSILNLFSDDVDISMKLDEDNSPCLMKFSSPVAKVNHYLQSKKFVKIQENSNGAYKKIKFTLETLTESNIDIEKDCLRQMSRASSILDDKSFKLVSEDNNVFAIFGDETNTVDNIKILIGKTIEGIRFPNITAKFSFEDFQSVLKSYSLMEGKTYIQFFQDKIYFSNTDDRLITSTIIRAK